MKKCYQIIFQSILFLSILSAQDLCAPTQLETVFYDQRVDLSWNQGSNFGEVLFDECFLVCEEAATAMEVAHDETSQTILLLHVCRKWQGSPESRLGQRIEWVRPVNLIQYKMPKPNSFLNSMLRDWVTTP